MKRILTLTLAVFLFATAASAAIEGTWTADRHDEKPGQIQFNINQGNRHNFGNNFRLSAFTGLSDAQIDAATQTPVKFEMRREAGTFAFEGYFRNGKGAGHVVFTPNTGYVNTLRSMGLELDLDKRGRRTEEEELFTLAALDVSTDYIRSIRAEGFTDLRLQKYTEMRIFDVTPEYIREMRALGYKDITPAKLVETKIHRVTPAYIREMRAAGWDLPLSKLVSSRIHGATPEFAAEMKKLGYGDLDHDDLVSFRIHRVTPEFIEELAKLGYKNVDADDLVAARIHRVTPEFIREVEAAGYKNVPLDKLVQMRIHGVDAKFIRKMHDVD